jgi:hypothetical protein
MDGKVGHRGANAGQEKENGGASSAADVDVCGGRRARKESVMSEAEAVTGGEGRRSWEMRMGE